MNVTVHVHRAPDRELNQFIVRHQENADAATQTRGWVETDDLRPLLLGQIVAEEFARAGAVRADDHRHVAAIAQRLVFRWVEAVDGVRVKVEVAGVFVVEALVSQFQFLIEEIGRHLVGQEAAAAAVLAHVDNQPGHALFVERAHHALPKLRAEQLVIGKAENLGVTDAVVQNLKFHRQFRAAATSVE